jgi:hypothetical protein
LDTADANQPARSSYLAQLAELLEDEPTRLSPDIRQRVRAILSDLSLNSRSAEDLISELAEDDQELAALWDRVQQEPDDADRGGDPMRPGRRGRGPTHLWVCPVATCGREPEKGLGWNSGEKKLCDVHGVELTPVRIPDA